MQSIPEHELLILESHVRGVTRSELYQHSNVPLTADQKEHLESLIQRRLTGEPLQYILGNQEFYGYQFTVRPGVLIPRPETEGLVELALNTYGDFLNAKSLNLAPRVLDFGTGSGCIGITFWLLSSWQATTTPVGKCVILTAESVVLTDCPPAPPER